MFESIIEKVRKIKESQQPVEIKERGMTVYKRKSTPEEAAHREYDAKFDAMSPEEKHHELALMKEEIDFDVQTRKDVARQERGGMSLWHSKKEQPVAKRIYPSPQGERLPKYEDSPSGRKRENFDIQSKKMKQFVKSLPEEEREEAVTRIHGFRSVAEAKELRIQKAKELFAEEEKAVKSYKYHPAERYEETKDEIKYQLQIAKRKAKEFATPAGFVGGLIDIVNPLKTREETIAEEREKNLKGVQLQKRKDLLEERQYQIEKAAALGSGRIPKSSKSTKVVYRKSTQLVNPLGNVGGFTFGGIPTSNYSSRSRTVVRQSERQTVRQVPIKRTEVISQRADEVLGLTSYGSVRTPIRTTVTKQVVRPTNSSVSQFGLPSINLVNPVSSQRDNRIPNRKRNKDSFLGLEGFF